MSLLERMTKDSIEARKARTEHATFLVTILADITQAAKAAQVTVKDDEGVDKVSYGRPATDDDADRIVRSTIKSFDKALVDLPADSAYAQKMKGQRAFLAAYIPEPLDDDKLKMAIRDTAQENDVPVDLKSMGTIMKFLNVKYPGQINGSKVREFLSSGAC